eukprot:TRINITY_DN107551_c0_g1_i1.p1 TRINITY_DN107551_c0_g1~~TRINITY_DN107551_c0_g1_i1.p1  ORF type:complete len:344 (-),score=68.39 TRINITY_DN107551_c0_g1_i1:36-1013(-)
MWARLGRCAARALPCSPAVAAGGFLASSSFPRPIATNCDSAPSSFRVGCYNVLCSTYAVKWKEQQGVGPDGLSNWPSRWPAMRDIIKRAEFDVLCLQEVEHTDVEAIVADLGGSYQTHYFKHRVRPPDGVLIAVRADAFEATPAWREKDDSGVAFAGVDIVHRSSGARVCVVTGHMRGKKPQQLKAFSEFADESSNADVTVITADFNEDFSSTGTLQCPFAESARGCYATLLREEGLPALSRPPNKQAEDQKSGKGKVDWIFVRGHAPDVHVEVFRDEASRRAILESHAPCEATGDWPSDHGCEALSVRVGAVPKSAWWQFWRRR